MAAALAVALPPLAAPVAPTPLATPVSAAAPAPGWGAALRPPARRAVPTGPWRDRPSPDPVDIRVTAAPDRARGTASRTFLPGPWPVAAVALPAGAGLAGTVRWCRSRRDPAGAAP
ncbi:hypothetical protein ACFVIM_24120 [Streptomyces sp. NPDC057638]|uniref:hypothetical protein n=1 Tax=Streptomyces sp. NPDC057638 TaxID=3346190 RepID=UPI003684EA25